MATSAPQQRVRRHRRHLLHRPVRALGARQLVGDGDRLHPGQDRLAREAERGPAARARSGSTRSSSTARTRSPTACRRTSTPRRSRSRSTSSPRSRSTRRGTPSSSSGSCRRSSGSGDGTMAGGMAATEDQLTWGHRKVFGYLEDDGRRLRDDRSHAQLARGRDALPRDHRGHARAARPALHRELPRAARRPARVPRGHPQRRARRAAPHRLRRRSCSPTCYAANPQETEDAIVETDPRGRAVHLRARQAAGLGRVATITLLRLHLRGARRSRACARSSCGCARSASTSSRIPRFPLADGPAVRGARPARPRPAAGQPHRPRPARASATRRRSRCCSTSCAARPTPSAVRPGTVIEWDFTDAEPWYLILDGDRTRVEQGPLPARSGRPAPRA